MAEEYIKREDAANAVMHSPTQKRAFDRICTLPAADVRPVVRGRWKRVDPRSTVVTFRCSKCDYYAHMNTENFCPNCGADMRSQNDPPAADVQPVVNCRDCIISHIYR